MYRFGIFGKPNVGKSSLFNALIDRSKAIVAEERGVTRDRVKGILRDENEFIALADLPGMEVDKKALSPDEHIQNYLKKELAEIDALIVVFDINDITPEDEIIYLEVKRKKISTLFIASKVDNDKKEGLLGELYQLGNEEFSLTSAKSKKGILDLRRKIFSLKNQLATNAVLPKKSNLPANDCVESFSIIGKPNVGKSSFLNSFLGWGRSLIKEERGTTRDAVDEFVFHKNKKYKIIDTAGIRKKKTKKNFLEELSLKKTFHSINQAGVILLLMDALEVEENFFELTDQDKKIVALIRSKKKTLLIFFNKWDLVKKKSWSNFEKKVIHQYPMLKNYPLEKLSCKKPFTKQVKNKIFTRVFNCLENHQIKIKTKDLNEAVKMALEQFDTNVNEKKTLKIYYAVQIKTSPPLMYFYINDRKYLAKKIVDYLNNYLTKYFDILGTPITMKFFNKEQK